MVQIRRPTNSIITHRATIFFFSFLHALFLLSVYEGDGCFNNFLLHDKFSSQLTRPFNKVSYSANVTEPVSTFWIIVVKKKH